MEGVGTYTWANDGVRFEGQFAGNSLRGNGRYEWDADGAVYDGEIWLCGILSKHLVQDLMCSSIAAGDVVDGLKEGYGSLHAIDSCSQYEGKWRSGKRHGSGKLR